MATIATSAHVSGDVTSDRAHKVWEAMKADAIARKVPKIVTKYGTGYTVIGSVQAYAARLFGLDARSRKAVIGNIRRFLKASGNVVVLEQRTSPQNRPENRIFVRDVWNPAISIPMGGGGGGAADRLTAVERRLTPHEAGEDRDPGPVTVKQVAEKKRKRATKGPVTIELPDGRFQCGGCGRIYDTTASLGSHKRKHFHEQMRAMTQQTPVKAVEDVQVPQVVSAPATGNPTFDAAIRALQEYPVRMKELRTLGAALDELREENRRLARENAELLAAGRTPTAAASDDEVVLGLITEALNRYNSADVGAGPMRTLMEIQEAIGVREVPATT